MNDMSAAHTPAGSLNWNVFNFSYHTPQAFPAVATFTFGVEVGTLKSFHQLKKTKYILSQLISNKYYNSN